MNLVNNLSSNSNKASAIPTSILASLAESLSSGQYADKVFADILSQNQPPPAAKPNTDTQANTNAGTQGTQNTDANGNQAEANSTPQATNQAPVVQDKTAVDTAGKHHGARQGTDKTKTATNNKPAGNTPAAAQTNAAANTQTNQSNPATTAAANAAQGGDQTADSTQDNTSGGDNADTNTNTDNSGTLAADLNAVTGQPAVTAAAQTPVMQTPATQVPAAAQQTGTSSSGDTTNTDNTAPVANGGNTDPQLMLLLMQLERLAAAARSATPAITAANAATAVQDPVAALLAPSNSAGTQGKSDLKSLMAAVTKSNVSDLLGNNNITDPGNNAGTDQNAQNAQAPANTAAPTAQQAAQTPAQQAATDKWMNNNFANLFNVTNNNQANVNIPTPVNVAANADLNIGDNDGASLDTDAQGQNQTGSRDIGANTSLNNNPLPATASAQGTNPYDFASELSAQRATKGGATGLPTPVEQVVLQLRNGLSKDGSSQMTIQLRPAELGRIDVKLNVSSDGKVQGTVTADNPATLNMLLKDVRGLERALQDAGLRADSGSLQFNLRGDGQPGGTYNQANNNSSSLTGNAPQNASTQLPVFADAAETYYLTPGGVNMRV